MRKLMILMVLCFASATVQAGVAIIAHPAAGVDSVDAKTAKKLFLGKKKSLPGMGPVTLVGQVDESPVKAEFVEKVTGKDLDKYKAFWARLIFSGKASPPKALANDDKVKEYVATHKDAVGYVDAGSVDGSVKVLLQVP